MRGPSQSTRREMAEWSAHLRQSPDEEAERGLDELLDRVLAMIGDDIAGDHDEGEPEWYGSGEGAAHAEDNGQVGSDEAESEADGLLSAAEGWAALVSHAVANVYAPNSPFPRSVAGFSRRALGRLRKISAALQGPLANAQAAMGATSFSISVSFPWGISVSLNW